MVVLVVAAVVIGPFLAGTAWPSSWRRSSPLPRTDRSPAGTGVGCSCPDTPAARCQCLQRNPSHGRVRCLIAAIGRSSSDHGGCHPTDVAQLTRAGASTNLPFHAELKTYDSGAFFIACRYPLSGANVVYFSAGLPLVLEDASNFPWSQPGLGDRLPSNAFRCRTPRRGELELVDRLLRSPGTAGLLLVGDFTPPGATRVSAPPGHRTVGRRRRSWKSIRHDVVTDAASRPPLVRIDHVLTGTGLVVTGNHHG